MKILAIETSCDETAISIVDANGSAEKPDFRVIAQVIHSQLALHAHWGGVVPNIAKREHQRALIPALKTAISESSLQSHGHAEIDEEKITEILSRETDLLPDFLSYIRAAEIPDIDAIAVTHGPGLEPALWVGVNFARALSLAWLKPLIPVNHMEGHFLSAGIESNGNWRGFEYPVVALLISGGHTEIVFSDAPGKYKKIGQTRDDAVGEAFDKVARVLGLPYPGGPEISKLANKFNPSLQNPDIVFPRPMLHSNDYDFSYSGLKTAVLYLVKKLGELDEKTKSEIAYKFEEAALDVLIKKTVHAANEFGAKTILVGGGVSANKKLHDLMAHAVDTDLPGTQLLFPAPILSTDNATMIALAGYFVHLAGKSLPAGSPLTASGTLQL